MNILLLGVGIQGKAALHDLARSDAVTGILAADRDESALRAHVHANGYQDRIRCTGLDAANGEALDRLMGLGHDVVVDLLPVGFLDAVTGSAVKHRVHVVNTFYVTPGLRGIGPKAEAAGVTILPELGLDPGIDLVLMGRAIRQLETIRRIDSYGAGIPEPAAANNPLRYKVSWTLEGVLRAYRRGATLIRDGQEVKVPEGRIFDPEHVRLVQVEGVGTLEAYPNGDVTPYLPFLGRKGEELREAGRYTMRWPGHSAMWKTLGDLGLLDDEPVPCEGTLIPPRRFLAAALEPMTRYGPRERDLAIVRVEAAGSRGGRPTRILLEVVDRRDLHTGLFGMARTVGYTASIGAQMIGRGAIRKRGLLSPVTDVPYEELVEELGKRGVVVREHLLEGDTGTPGERGPS